MTNIFKIYRDPQYFYKPVNSFYSMVKLKCISVALHVDQRHNPALNASIISSVTRIGNGWEKSQPWVSETNYANLVFSYQDCSKMCYRVKHTECLSSNSRDQSHTGYLPALVQLFRSIEIGENPWKILSPK